jgi:3-hydroxybutyryl-CoA dehydrogenase
VLVRTIAIIGANATGQQFALAAALAGYSTILEDVSREMLERGVAAIDLHLERAVADGELRPEARAVALARIASVVGVESAIRDADLIVEAVPEELEMKLELFTIFDKFAKPGAILASTTARLSILDISDVTVYRERCIGMRFRASSPGGAVMELVPSRMTSVQTMRASEEVAQRLAHKVLVAVDVASASPGEDSRL